MPLTDREIAILHLAIGDSRGKQSEFEEFFGLWRAAFDRILADKGHRHEDAERALAMAPLYRHAFGIEAPAAESEPEIGDVIRELMLLNAEWYFGKDAPPASLAIANALSRTR